MTEAEPLIVTNAINNTSNVQFHAKTTYNVHMQLVCL